jgi:hypothetical protein
MCVERGGGREGCEREKEREKEKERERERERKGGRGGEINRCSAQRRLPSIMKAT